MSCVCVRACLCAHMRADVTVIIDCQLFPLGQMGLETLDIPVSRVN